MAFKDLLNKGKEMALKGADSLKEQAGDLKGKISQSLADQKESAAPLEGAIIRYSVVYLGGLPNCPKKITGDLGMNIMPDCFHFHPTANILKDMPDDTIIPYDTVEKFEITRRQVSTSEFMLSSSGDTKSLEQENNIEITYRADGKQLVLRVEMLTGVTIYGQANKCREMMDILRQNGIPDKFAGEKKDAPATVVAALSPAEELRKFKALLDDGIISQEDFDEKKKQLLGM